MKNKKLIKFVSIFIVIIISIVSIFFVYVNDYYHADLKEMSVFSFSSEVIEKKLDNDKMVYLKEENDIGLIFYPGGKVEHIAYEPLMKKLAEKGITCVLIKMPFNLAVFDIDAADGVKEKLPNIKRWYIGGHSLGGAMASSYLKDNSDSFEGLILLGAYSSINLSNTNLKVISIYGSEDKVLNYKKYNKSKKNLPNNFVEEIIEGGCHSYFGVYGKQNGDGNPTISNEEQINITADIIQKNILEGK